MVANFLWELGVELWETLEEYFLPYYIFALFVFFLAFVWYWLLERNLIIFLNFLYYPRTLQTMIFIWSERRMRLGAHIEAVNKAFWDFDFPLAHNRTQYFVDAEERQAYDYSKFVEFDDSPLFLERIGEKNAAKKTALLLEGIVQQTPPVYEKVADQKLAGALGIDIKYEDYIPTQYFFPWEIYITLNTVEKIVSGFFFNNSSYAKEIFIKDMYSSSAQKPTVYNYLTSANTVSVSESSFGETELPFLIDHNNFSQHEYAQWRYMYCVISLYEDVVELLFDNIKNEMLVIKPKSVFSWGAGRELFVIVPFRPITLYSKKRAKFAIRAVDWTKSNANFDKGHFSDEAWWGYMIEQKSDFYRLFNDPDMPGYTEYDWVQRACRLFRWTRTLFVLRPLREHHSKIYAFDVSGESVVGGQEEADKKTEHIIELLDERGKDFVSHKTSREEVEAYLAAPEEIEKYDPLGLAKDLALTENTEYTYLMPLVFDLWDKRFAGKGVVVTTKLSAFGEISGGDQDLWKRKKRKIIRRRFVHLNDHFRKVEERERLKEAQKAAIEDDTRSEDVIEEFKDDNKYSS